ncbi:MAG: hypothetical protein ABIP17_16730 [Ilumatobacteraceae bacterium]
MSDTAVTPTNDAPEFPVPQLAAPTAPTLPPHPDTAVRTVAPGAPVEGDLPRLGSGPITSPAPSTTPTLPTTPALPTNAPTMPTTDPTLMPSLPAVDVAPAPQSDRFPLDESIDLASLPTLPQAAPAVSVFETDDDITAVGPATTGPTGEHPMAHLMPARSKPTQASINAAEARAAKKAKAKKVKILVLVGALAVSALVGPPFVSWLTGAINEAGSTNTETGE